ncbi:hypothetical protein [Krasilnikoviella flava]|uniref:Uncharacterized protein n=1 Tax=Krasilnikoviella flava TaxID=526729 RepID=A0A1T5IBV5_9MICO|nr:hypothetical protein [Krasilnikoviella flava]SKC36666.1 hypothetical protein SAMN04324258_0306 [Krasilnikoviella flava]
MSIVGTLLPALAAAPSPSPSPSQGPDELQVTPGLAGFVATFAVAVACVLLFLSLTRHLRRAQHNAEEQGIPLQEPKHLGFRRPDDDAASPESRPDDRPDDGDGPQGGPDGGTSDETDGRAGR